MYMEVYVSYMVGSSITALLGSVAYSYLYQEDTPVEVSEPVDYSLIDTTLNERDVNSIKDKRKQTRKS